MATFSTLAVQASRLSAALRGDVVLPGQQGFDEARRAFNLAADQELAAVVLAESAQDVVAAVAFAVDQGWQIAAQATGHNAMPLGSLADTNLLKTERMRGIQIDPPARTARVEAGAVWAEVVDAAAREGLAALAGSSPNVGVVGYTLGGGVSFLGRKYGLSANNVRAVEVVTADGRLRRVPGRRACAWPGRREPPRHRLLAGSKGHLVSALAGHDRLLQCQAASTVSPQVPGRDRITPQHAGFDYARDAVIMVVRDRDAAGCWQGCADRAAGAADHGPGGPER
jgi:hypothetical protein